MSPSGKKSQFNGGRGDSTFLETLYNTNFGNIAIMNSIADSARIARQAGQQILSQSPIIRNKALNAVRLALKDNARAIFHANMNDLNRSQEEGLAAH